ncbi:MAG TPA: Gfo/Idh/MocA family oxidoreductase [Tepidisphaeraceae bacterium]|nr:Gfo/Idh/MocA family oxidoreductase [Tepidisphaeraceae bacterium]
MINRRTFLKSSALALAAAPAILRADSPDASDQYTTALIGSGWWGATILTEVLALGRGKIIALCDPDPAQIDKCVAINSLGNLPLKRYTDYRELLDKEKPQIVINATPDHWHAQITIDSLRAGAHVYLEKPISHTILEGVAMVAAAAQANRVVQVDTHRRISPHNISAREFLRSGKAGKIGAIRAFVNYGGGPEKPTPNSAPPSNMDWDLYCGPAPLRPFNHKIHPKGFRNFLDYANGEIGDWGVHWFDQVLWIMDRQAPTTVFSSGGRPVRGPAINDGQSQTTDAPDHQAATFVFDGFTCTWEHREFGGNNAEKGENLGVYFFGTEGTFHLGWQSGWTFYPADSRKQTLHQDAQLHTPAAHNIRELYADFLDAIDKKRPPVCTIESGHRATTCALLAMLSLKLGRSIQWDAKSQTIPNDPEAQSLLKRNYRGPWKYPTV